MVLVLMENNVFFLIVIWGKRHHVVFLIYSIQPMSVKGNLRNMYRYICYISFAKLLQILIKMLTGGVKFVK